MSTKAPARKGKARKLTWLGDGAEAIVVHAEASNFERGRVRGEVTYCTCAECKRDTVYLKARQAWEQYCAAKNPPVERIRLWCLWRGFTPHAALLLGLLAETWLAVYCELLAEIFPEEQVATIVRDIANEAPNGRVAGHSEGGVCAAVVTDPPMDVMDLLHGIELTDEEIAVLQRIHVEQRSHRDAADLCGISTGKLAYVLSRGLTKITKAGYFLAELLPQQAPITYSVDPAELDRLPSREQPPGIPD